MSVTQAGGGNMILLNWNIAIVFAMMFSFATTNCFAWGSSNKIGVGYIVKIDNTKIYSDDVGDDVDDNCSKSFPLVAVNKSGIISTLIGANTSALASEEEKNGRLHVRYWKNGKNSADGENTGWVEAKNVTRFNFCCDDNSCSGIKAQMFSKSTYSDCFIAGMSEAIDKQDSLNSKGDDIEKLKLQLEIEKLKLEQEKLKLQNKLP